MSQAVHTRLDYESIKPPRLKSSPHMLLATSIIKNQMDLNQKRDAVVGNMFALFNTAWGNDHDTIYITKIDGHYDNKRIIDVPNPDIAFISVDPSLKKFGQSYHMLATDIGSRPCPYGNHVTAVKWDFQNIDPNLVLDTDGNFLPSISSIAKREYQDIGHYLLNEALDFRTHISNDPSSSADGHRFEYGSWYNATIVVSKMR